VERAAGIEPACLTWKDSALPSSKNNRKTKKKRPLILVQGWTDNQQRTSYKYENST